MIKYVGHVQEKIRMIVDPRISHQKRGLMDQMKARMYILVIDDDCGAHNGEREREVLLNFPARCQMAGGGAELI